METLFYPHRRALEGEEREGALFVDLVMLELSYRFQTWLYNKCNIKVRDKKHSISIIISRKITRLPERYRFLVF